MFDRAPPRPPSRTNSPTSGSVTRHPQTVARHLAQRGLRRVLASGSGASTRRPEHLPTAAGVTSPAGVQPGVEPAAGQPRRHLSSNKAKNLERTRRSAGLRGDSVILRCSGTRRVLLPHRRGASSPSPNPSCRKGVPVSQSGVGLRLAAFSSEEECRGKGRPPSKMWAVDVFPLYPAHPPIGSAQPLLLCRAAPGGNPKAVTWSRQRFFSSFPLSAKTPR